MTTNYFCRQQLGGKPAIPKCECVKKGLGVCINKCICTLLAVLIVWPLSMLADPASPDLKQAITLDDGTTVECRLVGNEDCHYWIDVNDNVYVQDIKTKAYSRSSRAEVKKRAAAAGSKPSVRPNVPFTPSQCIVGQQRLLAILVEFPNARFRAGHDKQLFGDILNAEGYTDNGFDGSVHDYYYDQSYGQLDLTFDIVGPFMMPEPYEYYGMNSTYTYQMVETAIRMADEVVDYSQYVWEGMDRVSPINIIFAGFSESSTGNVDNIWSACTTMDDYCDGVRLNRVTYSSEMRHVGERELICGIGAFCHELAHGFGLPDIYDQTTGNYGTQNWDLMDIGCHGNFGITPSGMTAYDKYSLGWVDPVILYGDISVSGMQPMSQRGDCYKIQNPCYENEFYLLEYRDQSKWDRYLPGHGMLIMHVDYDKDLFDRNIVNRTGPEYDNDHERCRLILADNDPTKTNEGYKGDLWPYAGNDALTATSVPAAILYNHNADGSYLMHKDITDIKENAGSMSFKFINHIDKQYYGVTAYSDYVRFTSETSIAYHLVLHNTQNRTFNQRLKFSLCKYADGKYHEMQTFTDAVAIEANDHKEYAANFSNVTFDDPNAEYYVQAYYQSRDEDNSWLLMTVAPVNTDDLTTSALVPADTYQYIIRDDNSATLFIDISNKSFRDFDEEIWLFTYLKPESTFEIQSPRFNTYRHLGPYESQTYVFELTDLLPDNVYYGVLYRYDTAKNDWQQLRAPFRINVDPSAIEASSRLDAEVNRLSVHDSQMVITSESDFANSLKLSNKKERAYVHELKYVLCKKTGGSYQEIASIIEATEIAANGSKEVMGTFSNGYITNLEGEYYIFTYYKKLDDTEYLQQLDKAKVSVNTLGGNRLKASDDYRLIIRDDNTASLTVDITNYSYLDFSGRAVTMFTSSPGESGWQEPRPSVTKYIPALGVEEFTFELTDLERDKEYIGCLFYNPIPNGGWAVVEPGKTYSIIVSDSTITDSVNSPISDDAEVTYRIYTINGIYIATVNDPNDTSSLNPGLYIIKASDGTASKLLVK